MQKLGGIICDMCRTLIRGEVPFQRKAKKGNILHFCSDKCKLNDTMPLKKGLNNLRGVEYGAHIYLYTTGANTSGGANMIYQYDPATNSITTWWTMPRSYSIGSDAVS